MKAVLIEAFSDRPCAGNGAAVVLLEQPLEDQALQALAGSLRQSETAFLLRHDPHWLLRWFTPSCEVPLCGHATLAAALALAHWQLLAAGEGVCFLTHSGPLPARLDPVDGRRASIDLPGGGMQEAQAPPALVALLERRRLGPPQRFWTSALGYAVVLLAAESPLEAMATIAAELPVELARGLVLMQPQAASIPPALPPLHSPRPVDYRLRFFAPGLGIDEDPVTGSAHALVAPWWMQQLGRSTVVGWQCSDRPGGVVCQALSSGKIRLFGAGHLLWDGTLYTQTQMESAPALSGPLPASASVDSALSPGWRQLLADA